MERRQALKLISGLLGTTLSAPVVSWAMANSASLGSSAAGAKTLTNSQLGLIADIADLIIPDTDTPGAKAAEVPEFIHMMLTEWFGEPARQQFLGGLNDLDVQSEHNYGCHFLVCSPEQKRALLLELDKEAIAARNSRSEVPFFGVIKELTLVGYYTSEVGQKTELKSIPGPGDPSVGGPFGMRVAL